MVLRTTFTDGQVIFEDLSDKFILTSKQRCPEKFEELARQEFGGNESHPPNDMGKDCYAFIGSLRAGTFNIPIYTDYHYSLLSERGCELMRITIGGL